MKPGTFCAGRNIEADDQTPGAHPVAALSFNFWQRRFGADPNIVGKTINLNNYPFTIIGVAPQGFHGVEIGVAPDVRIPLMDLRMLGFTPGVTLLSALFFGLLPALQATRPNPIPALKNESVVVTGGGRRWELGRLLVVLQVALSLVLLVGAGLFGRSLRNLKLMLALIGVAIGLSVALFSSRMMEGLLFESQTLTVQSEHARN